MASTVWTLLTSGGSFRAWRAGRRGGRGETRVRHGRAGCRGRPPGPGPPRRAARGRARCGGWRRIRSSARAPRRPGPESKRNIPFGPRRSAVAASPRSAPVAQASTQPSAVGESDSRVAGPCGEGRRPRSSPRRRRPGSGRSPPARAARRGSAQAGSPSPPAATRTRPVVAAPACSTRSRGPRRPRAARGVSAMAVGWSPVQLSGPAGGSPLGRTARQAGSPTALARPEPRPVAVDRSGDRAVLVDRPLERHGDRRAASRARAAVAGPARRAAQRRPGPSPRRRR